MPICRRVLLLPIDIIHDLLLLIQQRKLSFFIISLSLPIHWPSQYKYEMIMLVQILKYQANYHQALSSQFIYLSSKTCYSFIPLLSLYILPKDFNMEGVLSKSMLNLPTNQFFRQVQRYPMMSPANVMYKLWPIRMAKPRYTQGQTPLLIYIQNISTMFLKGLYLDQTYTRAITKPSLKKQTFTTAPKMLSIVKIQIKSNQKSAISSSLKISDSAVTRALQTRQALAMKQRLSQLMKRREVRGLQSYNVGQVFSNMQQRLSMLISPKESRIAIRVLRVRNILVTIGRLRYQCMNSAMGSAIVRLCLYKDQIRNN